MVGQLLDKLKALGLEENTIVMYSTDTGAERLQLARRRLDAVSRGEERKLGRWLSRALRHPLARVIKPGTINNDVFSHEDMLPTLLAPQACPM